MSENSFALMQLSKDRSVCIDRDKLFEELSIKNFISTKFKFLQLVHAYVFWKKKKILMESLIGDYHSNLSIYSMNSGWN